MPPLATAAQVNLLVYHYLKESGAYRLPLVLSTAASPVCCRISTARGDVERTRAGPSGWLLAGFLAGNAVSRLRAISSRFEVSQVVLLRMPTGLAQALEDLSTSSASTQLTRCVYLSGFAHASFSLRHEARLDEAPHANEAVVAPGALVRFLQKGLLYCAVEAHVSEVSRLRCRASQAL